jgi:hypothetical protein
MQRCHPYHDIAELPSSRNLRELYHISQPKMLNRVLASPIAKTNMLLLYKKTVLLHSTTISARANYPSMT